jgi:glycosyltransferase 2 family protein
MKRLVQLIVSAVLTVLIGWVLYLQVPDWGQAWRVMFQARPLMQLCGLFFVLLHIICRAARWGAILVPAKAHIPFKSLFSLTLVKYVVNLIPPRSGEVAASAVLAKKERIATATVIAASMLERIMDMITVLVIFGCYLVLFGHRYAPNSEHGREIMLSVRSYSIKGALALAVAIAVLLLLLRSKTWSEKIPPRVRKYVLHFLEGFRVLHDRNTMIKVIALSVAIWLSITCQIWFYVRSYVDGFPLAGSLLVMALTVVGVSIPTPGGVGGFQFFMNLTLLNFFSEYLSSADPISQAAGISNGTYLASMGPIILMGLIMLYREGLSLTRLTHISEEQES